MLSNLAKLLAACLGCVALYANFIYAWDLGADPALRALWVGIAVCSAGWTACGLSATCRQWEAGAYGRATGAAVLLLASLAFDALAGYDLSYREIKHKAEAERQDTGARTELNAEIARLASALARPVPELAEAKASYESASAVVSLDDCRAVTMPNKYKTETADRIRDACERLTDARLLLAAATARPAIAQRLAAAQKQLKELGPVASGDARTRLLPAETIAWLPVVLVLLGAVLGPWVAESAAPAPAAKPVTPPAAEPTHKAAPDCAAVVAALVKADASGQAPSNVERDSAGRLVASQRVLAAMAGVGLSRLNRELQNAAAAGLIEVDTSGAKTAIRVLGAARAA